jgi:hypothetical protein
VLWDEEEKKLRLQHQLEKKRLHMKGAWSLGGVLLVALSAYWVAPYYADYFKQKEIESSAKLQLRLQRQALFYQEQFRGYRAIDSAYTILYDTYRGAALHSQLTGNPANVTASLRAVADSMNFLFDQVHRYINIVDEKYRHEAEMHASFYACLRGIPLSEWPVFDPFFNELRLKLIEIEGRQFSELVRSDTNPKAIETFELDDPTLSPSSFSRDAKADADLLRRNYELWTKWKQGHGP